MSWLTRIAQQLEDDRIERLKNQVYRLEPNMQAIIQADDTVRVIDFWTVNEGDWWNGQKLKEIVEIEFYKDDFRERDIVYFEYLTQVRPVSKIYGVNVVNLGGKLAPLYSDGRCTIANNFLLAEQETFIDGVKISRDSRTNKEF